MPKSEPIEVEATVTTALPNAMFKLKLDNSQHEILGIVSGKMRKHFIRILPGDRVKVQLIARIDADYGVYEGGTFKARSFAAWLAGQNIAWPRLPSGALALDDDTFRQMARRYPELQALRELRVSLSQLRLQKLAVGSDVWKSYRLIDDDHDDDSPPDDASASLHHILRLRSELGLEHVFALLGLVFPTQPLQIALQSLYTQDRSLHATALEYLESILPADLRELLWPLVEGQARAVASRPATDVAEALRMSQPLIAEKLSKRANRK